jgi:hypothetical protein
MAGAVLICFSFWYRSPLAVSPAGNYLKSNVEIP